MSLHLLGALPSAGEKEPERLPRHLFLSVPHPGQASSPPSPGEVVHSDHRLFLWERQPRCLALTEHEFHFLWCIWFLLKVCSPVCPVLRGCSRVRARVRGLSRPLGCGPLPFPPLPAPHSGQRAVRGAPSTPKSALPFIPYESAEAGGTSPVLQSRTQRLRKVVTCARPHCT